MPDGSLMAEHEPMVEGTAGEPVLLNKQEMAEVLGITVPTLNAWIRDGLPIDKEGGRAKGYQFDPDKVLAWRSGRIVEAEKERQQREETIKALQSSLDLAGADNDVPHVSARARKEYYDAEKLRIELDRQRGFLCLTSEVLQEKARLLGVLSDRLQSLPDFLERRAQLAPELVDELQKAIDEWQRELAAELMADEEPVDDVA